MKHVRRHLFLVDKDILNILKERYNGQKLSKMRNLYLALCEIIDKSEGGETISLEIVSKTAGLSTDFVKVNLDIFRELNVIDIKN